MGVEESPGQERRIDSIGADSRLAPLHVRTEGTGPRTLWVHGAMSDAARTWKRQLELAENWQLLLPCRRGTPPSPAAEGNDYEVDARDLVGLLDKPTHLVAHSYGCVGALLATGIRPANVRSLTVVEPPLHQLANTDPAVRAARDAHLRTSAIAAPEEYFREFVRAQLGVSDPPPLPPADRSLVELSMNERPPWDAELPISTIVGAGIPVLVVTGGHSAMFERCADALTELLAPNAQRWTLPGAGHFVPRLGQPFNQLLEGFWKGSF